MKIADERILVTPQMAREWLDNYSRKNRYISLWTVRYYVRQLQSGVWRETHQGVAFDDRGALVDGYHRLRAIIESGISARLLVTRGLSQEAVLVIDTGRPRSVADNLTIFGFDASRELVTVSRLIDLGIDAFTAGKDRIFPDEAMRLVQKHREAASFAYQCLPGSRRKGINATIRGLVGRASYSSDLGLLKTFCDVLVSGDSSMASAGHDPKVVILLRDLTLGGAAQADRFVFYRKASRALSGYLDGGPLTKLYATEVELFHLPGESR